MCSAWTSARVTTRGPAGAVAGVAAAGLAAIRSAMPSSSRSRGESVAVAAQLAGRRGVVAAVVQQGVGGELGVGRLGVKRRRGAEHVQAAVLAGGRRDARCLLAGPPPAVRAGAKGAGAPPAVRGQDLLPAGPRAEVVPWPVPAVAAAGRGGNYRLPWYRLGEQRGDGVQGVAFVGGDGGDGGRAAARQPPWL